MLLLLAAVVSGFDPMKLPRAKPNPTVPVVELAPVFYEPFVCGEHPYGSLHYVGDALGRDCVVVGGIDPATDIGFPRPFRTSAATNADWYGWHAAVHAPFTGRVIGLHQNSNENTPGTSGNDLAGYVAFHRSDGLMVTYAHVANVTVRIGQEVAAGQVVGVVGNNGHARMPHVHIGAWRGTTAYQIRWDLRSRAGCPPSSINSSRSGSNTYRLIGSAAALTERSVNVNERPIVGNVREAMSHRSWVSTVDLASSD